MKSNTTFEQMLTFWKLKGMGAVQDRSENRVRLRIITQGKTFIIIHSPYHTITEDTLKYLIIYEGEGYTKRLPEFETADRNVAITKLQEFF